MASSQNGYQVLDKDTSGPWPHLRDWDIPGANRNLLLRDGSAGFLLVHFAVWFNDSIEKIDSGYDDWGWSPRKIGGTSTWSNHASGTAIDLNAGKHPQGKVASATFSSKQCAQIRTRLKLYAGCIKWGGDYRSNPDPMHYEINKPPDQVVKRAQELLTTTRGRAVLSVNKGAREIIL